MYPYSPYYDTLAMLALWWFLLLMLACPICSLVVADSKGRNSLVWFFVGLIFGPFGLLAAIGVPALDREAERAYAGKASRKMLCPACREPMWADATVCPHCTTLIEDGEADPEAII